MLGMRAMCGIRDLTFSGVEFSLRNSFGKKHGPEEFSFERVLADALKAAGLSHFDDANTRDTEYWKKLCVACGDKQCSPVGSQLLRKKLVQSLSQRLAVDEAFRLNGDEISREKIVEPYFVLGLPRSGGHFVTHVFNRSGLFLSPRMRDTWSPSLAVEAERVKSFDGEARQFTRLFPNFSCVRQLNHDIVDDDLTLSMQVPFSYAWGLLHGLDEYLLQCIQEDQTPVFDHLKRVLQLFQWYSRCGHFSDGVKVEFNTIDNAFEHQRLGHKQILTKMPWLIHSPLGLLNAKQLHSVFPDMSIIWTHRALAYCVPSLCSSLAIHNSLYTGRAPSETVLAQIGEKVLGIFGSGSELAIDYFASFDKQKMVHWSNRDANRHCARLMMKTMYHFNLEIDRFRRINAISAQTEYQGQMRPLHDSQLQYFGLHEGVIGQVFNAYIHQFEEFAFERKFGISLQNYQPIASTNDEQLIAKQTSSPNVPIGDSKPMAGHFMAPDKMLQ